VSIDAWIGLTQSSRLGCALTSRPLLAFLVCAGCGASSSIGSTDAGDEVAAFYDGGSGALTDIPSCASAFTTACAADIYAEVEAQIDLSTSLFRQSALQGGYLTLTELNSATSTLGPFFNSEGSSSDAAGALIWVESLLYPATSANWEAIDGKWVTSANFHSDVEIGVESLNEVLSMEVSDAGFYATDAGLALIADTQSQGFTAASVAASYFPSLGNAYSPIDFKFTPNYTVVGLARAMGAWSLWYSFGHQTGFAALPNSVLTEFAGQVSQFATATRARAANRCTEEPVSPVCAIVASHETETVAPALDRLAAQMLVAADAGVAP
jgi:hypothetical protein